MRNVDTEFGAEDLLNSRMRMFHGVQYGGESDWGAKPISVAANLLVLYKPLDPAVNLPLTRLLFYSFDAYGS